MHIIVDNQKIRAKFITFAGGEEHVQLCMEDVESAKSACGCGAPGAVRYFQCDNMVAYGYLKSSQDLMRYMNMVNAAQQIFEAEHLVLNIPYMIYARQDRACSPGQAFGLQMAVEMLASLMPDEVIIDDPHSQVVREQFELHDVKFTGRSQADIFMQYYKSPNNRDKFKDFALVAPDHGASLKTLEIANRCSVEMFQADKERDPNTGKLSGFNVTCGDFKGKNLWIVDDICDFGGTFIGLAKILKERNCGKLGLHVTHGLFSGGTEVLYEHFDYVGAEHNWLIPEVVDEF